MDLPASFTAYTRSILGDGEYDRLAAAIGQEPPVSIRLNSGKWRKENDEYPFRAPFGKVPWASGGYYLEERPTFTFDPLFHAGCYYVQEASSMFVEQVLRQYVAEPVVMLDLCAAPGGKSTHVRSVLPEGSLLVANEVMRNRSQVLAENLAKWGHPDVVVTNNDPADFSSLPSFFDVILTDVPCSGEGMFRKDPVAVEEWSPENVEICWQRQRRIIADIWSSLKPGGILIYSTCTYNTKEDEENVRWICGEFGAESLQLDVCGAWNITGDLSAESASSAKLPVYHFFPHKTKGEGFFLAALRKPQEGGACVPAFSLPPSKPAKKKDRKGGGTPSLLSKEHLHTAEGWLDSDRWPGYVVSAEAGRVYAFPQRYANELAAMKQSLRVVSAGVDVGEVKGKDLVPSHALAMSLLLRQDAFAVEAVTYEQAIAYLRKEAIALLPTAPRGYVLLTYRGFPLGFAKNIGNRANNLYPQEWRIRSGYLPEEIKTVFG
ncbi:RsmF rRNA methyltransferase first C-terminal domain-containing protein [uncultured Bacteroides sp.]|uniref:RsmF rRNA methyltransferase first C-terminal domain-containing protein n=2 Tax=uncultured Bacteroides sp. TaxID=162156 RepID=UPI0025F7DE92|nr:RsmF rRNA methyltransferase first C-terminal domain-containing protein [uncultured Bacteroides sp.]